MKPILTLCTLFLLILNSSLSNAQEVKIGYTNIELVLSYMPETKQMQSNLNDYQNKLSQKLRVKEQATQKFYAETIEKVQNGTMSPEEQSNAEKELAGMQREMQQLSAESERQLVEKQNELMQPILEKLQSTINKVAENNGFRYIMNQTTSGQVSNILYGPEEDDITILLFEALGIENPKP